MAPEGERRTFMGFRWPDGRVGTRNYVAVLASVNCSSSATVCIVRALRSTRRIDDYPNVDGVIALPHSGCGAHIGSRDLYIFQRTGWAPGTS
ncbi:MAG: UxaA family hydrolase [Thermomicrobiales bacterium]